MRNFIKQSVFHVSKYMGLFVLSRWLLRNKLRVLCYHGFTLQDEHLNVPGLFIEPHVFEKRMAYLWRQGYQVISLEQAFSELTQGIKRKDRVVITIDDGYVSVLRKAAPVMKKYQFPSTLYLTSYFFNKDCPVFTLAVNYMFWKTPLKVADFTALGLPALSEHTQCELNDENKNKIAITIKEHGQSLKGNEKRIAILELLGEILQVDYHRLNQARLFNLVSIQELEALREHDVDIQLHTHRHTFPVDEKVAEREIEDNKAAVNPLLPTPMKHFCYPSGVWSQRHWPVLEKQSIATATICQTGFVDKKSPHYAWPRVLDSSRVTQIEFEAEVSGFNEILRKITS